MIVCIHSEPDIPRVLPRARVSPDAAAPSASFLSALKSPPFNLQSPLRPGGGREQQLSAAAEAAVAAAREEGAPGLIPYVPEGLVEPLVGAFGVLSAADASDKRPRWGRRVLDLRGFRLGVVLPLLPGLFFCAAMLIFCGVSVPRGLAKPRREVSWVVGTSQFAGGGGGKAWEKQDRSSRAFHEAEGCRVASAWWGFPLQKQR